MENFKIMKPKDLTKNAEKKYNTTDLDPETTFERHVFHRDQFAHYLRWTHILREARIGETIVDFGCGKGNLLEVLYRNKFKQANYIGLDIRSQTIKKAQEKYEDVEWACFIEQDLVVPTMDFTKFQADKVCSFEVVEHVGRKNVGTFLENFAKCGKKDATYYLSTPNYDPEVGAAQNHIYNGEINELAHTELHIMLQKVFTIEAKYGTFASQKDYKPLLSEWQRKMFEEISKYYDSNLVANIMAPMFPEQSRNCLWVLKRKTQYDIPL